MSFKDDIKGDVADMTADLGQPATLNLQTGSFYPVNVIYEKETEILHVYEGRTEFIEANFLIATDDIPAPIIQNDTIEVDNKIYEVTSVDKRIDGSTVVEVNYLRTDS